MVVFWGGFFAGFYVVLFGYLPRCLHPAANPCAFSESGLNCQVSFFTYLLS